MSRALWLVAIVAVVIVTLFVGAFLLWPDNAPAPAAPRPVAGPAATDGDGGRLWRPHPDRAGLHRRPVQ